MNAIFAILNGWEMVAILAVVLVMFGAKRLPQMARGLGEGLREFRKATNEPPDESQEGQEKKLEKDKTKTEFI